MADVNGATIQLLLVVACFGRFDFTTTITIYFVFKSKAKTK